MPNVVAGLRWCYGAAETENTEGYRKAVCGTVRSSCKKKKKRAEHTIADELETRQIIVVIKTWPVAL